MIGYVKGTLVAKQAPWITVEAGGLGYEIETPMSTYLQLPPVGQAVSVLTHFLVREDAQLLYGFTSERERQLFRGLLKVSGVGARIALAILSGISVDGFARCVQLDDVATLIKVPGVGRKTAERLIIEMRDRLDDTPATATSKPMAAASPDDDGRADALAALVALGYKDTEVRKVIALVGKESKPESTEDYIRLCLKHISGQGR